MTTKAIFWDNDGVLVDTERLYFAATRDVLARRGFALSRELFLENFLITNLGLDFLAGQGWHADRIDEARGERNALYSELLQKEDLVIAGVREVLAELAGHYVMCIVTSSRKDHFELIHRQTGLLPHFQFVLASGDYPRSKPCPDPYLCAVERSGFRANECIVIEDSERGLQSAVAAGLRCVVIPTDLTRDGRFAGAHAVLSSVKDVPAFLREA